MHDYYYRDGNEDEVIVQVTGNTEKPLSIRVTEEDHETAMINLPAEEIDNIIAALQLIKKKF
jgi:hypothetical protein